VSIAASLALIAIGAILRYAVNVDIADIDLQTVGLILMIVGVLGLVVTLFLAAQTGRDPRDPPSY
jgi:uncharacterized protein DUF6458